MMETMNKLRIQKCWDEMVSSLDFDIMSPILIQNNIITTKEYELLKNNSNNSEKVIVQKLCASKYLFPRLTHF